MSAKVYFVPSKVTDDLKTIHRKIQALFDKGDFWRCFSEKDEIAIKIHFGEEGNDTHISPDYFSLIIKTLTKKGALPFYTDTCVLYRSKRSDAVNHLRLADKHGFTYRRAGAPVIIADGLRGGNETEVEINGQLFDKVSIATEAVVANAMICATHITGHMASGLGGTIKNLGMGLASRKGKLRQHSSVKPWIEVNHCTGCGDCLFWCPENAISMNGDVAVINEKLCVGCGECLTVCRFGAVRYNWQTSSENLQRKMAEHALGAIKNKADKTCYLSFLTNITKDCDCLNKKQKPAIEDIGIIASRDPVAIDKATLDLIEQHSGKSLTSFSYPSINPNIQIEHGEKIGLGTQEYELVKLEYL